MQNPTLPCFDTDLPWVLLCGSEGEQTIIVVFRLMNRSTEQTALHVEY
jgi:hypothetical protein